MEVLTWWKVLVFFYIFLLLVSGLSVICTVSYYILIHVNISYFYGQTSLPIFSLYAIPLLLLINILVGWHGVRRENVTMLRVFSVTIALTALVEVGLAGWCIAARGEVCEIATAVLENDFLEVRKDPDSLRRWDNIQVELKCCGVKGPHDYYETGQVPFTCCEAARCTHVYQEGCLDTFMAVVKQEMVMLSLLAAGLVVLHVPGVFLSWCLSNRLFQARPVITGGEDRLLPAHGDAVDQSVRP